jgi:putative colanic acid biosynthesis UDP-glucose lipid carrier transferase
VKPGITGWAQINRCRGELDSADKLARRVELDLEYIENWSPLLDLRILAVTAWRMLHDDDAY